MAYYNPYSEITRVLAQPPVVTKEQVTNAYNQAKIANQQAPQEEPQSQIPYGNILKPLAAGVGGYSMADQNASSLNTSGGIGDAANVVGAFATGGPLAGGAALLGSAVGQVTGMNKALNNVDTSVGATEFDAFGRPLYQGNQVINASRTADQLQDYGKKLTGYQRIFGGKRKVRRKVQELQRNIRGAQSEFNNAAVAYNKQQNAMDQYNELLNNRTRLNNLYSIGTSLY